MWTPINSGNLVIKYSAFSVCCGLMLILRLPEFIQCIFYLYPDPCYINNNWFVLGILYVNLRIWWKSQHFHETSLNFLARSKHVLDTQLKLTNDLVRYVTTNLKHKWSVFESVMRPLRRTRHFSSLCYRVIRVCLRDHDFLARTKHTCVAHTTYKLN